MTTKILFGVLCIVSAAIAQQEGAIAIAETIVPAAEVVVGGFIDCVSEQRNAGASIDQANKVCEDVVGKASKTSRRIAGKASKAARPRLGFGGGYGYTSYGGWSTPIYPQRRMMVPRRQYRPAPPPRPLPPPRRWERRR